MMKNYIVGYDLNSAGQNYPELISAIEKYTNPISVLRSVWFIQSELSAEAILNDLTQFIDSNDEIIVLEFSRNSSLYLKQENIDEIKQRYASKLKR